MEHCCYPSWFYGLIGVLFLVVGYFLWSGSWTLEQAVGAVIIIWGIKKLVRCCGPMLGKK